jgi:hypothetical protein
MLRGQDVVTKIDESVKEKGAMSGVLADALAIAPLNLTPRRLKDMVTHQGNHFSLAEMALASRSSNEVETILLSALVVSGVPRHPEGFERGWERLWNKFYSTDAKVVRPAEYKIVDDNGNCYSVKVR